MKYRVVVVVLTLVIVLQLGYLARRLSAPGVPAAQSGLGQNSASGDRPGDGASGLPPGEPNRGPVSGPGDGPASGKPGQGPGEPGQGPGKPGQGPGKPGQGPGKPGQGPGEAGQGPGKPGQGPGEAGQGPARPGQASGEAGQGHGPEPAPPGQGPGKPGQEPAQPGQGPGPAPPGKGGTPVIQRQVPPPSNSGGGHVTIEMMPYSELFAGLLMMDGADGHASFNADQKSKLRPTVTALISLLKAPGNRPTDAADMAGKVLNGAQISYILKHRADPLSGDASGAEVTKTCLTMLKKRASEQPTAAQLAAVHSNAVPNASDGALGPEDLQAGLIKLERVPALAVTPAQARELASSIEHLSDVSQQVEEQLVAIVALLDADQKDFLLKQHDKFIQSAAPISEPPERLLAQLLERLK